MCVKSRPDTGSPVLFKLFHTDKIEPNSLAKNQPKTTVAGNVKIHR